MGVVYWAPICTVIGIINLIVFGLQQVDGLGIHWGDYMLHPGNADPHQYFTSMFMHANWAHLTGNAFFLFAFGCGLEKRAGWLVFLLVYFISGLGGCLLYEQFGQGMPLVGASGAIFGIICSMAILDAKAFVVMPGAPLPVPVLLAAVFYIANEYSMLDKADSVAHYAHIGGGLAGAGVGLLVYKFTKRS